MTEIVRVEAFPLPYRETNDHGSIRYSCLARVETADGVVGWGEAATITRPAALATAALIEGYADALLGTQAHPDAAGRTLTQAGWWHGGAGIDSFAVSAIDMALWDGAARRAGVSLAQLLGVAADASLPTVLTAHASDADLHRMSEQLAQQMRDRGAIGVKIAFGKAGESRLGVDIERDVAFVAALRRAVGADALIMVDVAPTLRWTLDDVSARLPRMAEEGLNWLEEPIGARDDAGYAALARDSHGVRIATGEREWNVQGVRDVLAAGGVDVIGLDPGRVRGVSGFREAAEVCARARVDANAHAFAGPLIHSASLALSADSEACAIFEVAPERNELYDILGAPEWHDSVGPVSPFGGAGLGFAVDEHRVRAAAIL